MNYTVKAGDTLSRIASAFGVTVAALQGANGIADANRISAGQVLTIPAAGVTLNAAGQVLPPPAATGVSSGSFWDGLANAFQVGAQSWNSIKQAEFARKQARAEGIPISPYLGNEVTGVQTQAGPSDGMKNVVGAAFFLLTGVLVAGLFTGSNQTARNRNR